MTPAVKERPPAVKPPELERVKISSEELEKSSQLLRDITGIRRKMLDHEVTQGEATTMLTKFQDYVGIRYAGTGRESLNLKPRGGFEGEHFEVGFKGGRPVEVSYVNPNGVHLVGDAGGADYTTLRLKREGDVGPGEFQALA